MPDDRVRVNPDTRANAPRAAVRPRYKRCKVCTDGVFRVRERPAQPAHDVPCPYCDGTGEIASVC